MKIKLLNPTQRKYVRNIKLCERILSYNEWLLHHPRICIWPPWYFPSDLECPNYATMSNFTNICYKLLKIKNPNDFIWCVPISHSVTFPILFTNIELSHQHTPSSLDKLSLKIQYFFKHIGHSLLLSLLSPKFEQSLQFNFNLMI